MNGTNQTPQVMRYNAQIKYIGMNSWEVTEQLNTLGTITIQANEPLIITSEDQLFQEGKINVKLTGYRNGAMITWYMIGRTDSEITIDIGAGLASDDILYVEIEVFDTVTTTTIAP